MNITIPNSKNPSTPMARPALEVNDESTVDFHKHCQKTVCSAYGYEGSGATWDILAGSSNPESDMGLPNIQDALSGGETVISYFNKNGHTNITYDLRAILELIEKVAATTTSPTYTLTFNDNNGQRIVNGTLSPNNRNVVFGGFGRDVELGLTINGDEAKKFKFNTMRALSEENLNIDIEIPDQTPLPGQFINVGADRTIELKTKDLDETSSCQIGVNGGKIVPYFFGIGPKTSMGDLILWESNDAGITNTPFPAGWAWNRNGTAASVTWFCDPIKIEHDGVLQFLVDTISYKNNGVIIPHNMCSAVLQYGIPNDAISEPPRNNEFTWFTLASPDVDNPGNS